MQAGASVAASNIISTAKMQLMSFVFSLVWNVAAVRDSPLELWLLLLQVSFYSLLIALDNALQIVWF